MLKRMIAGVWMAGMALAALNSGAQAQDVTLKLHQFLPLRATIPAQFLTPWIEKVEAQSGGRIKIQHFPSMQLGGKPPELIQQATDGAVDLVWTVLGYTPGRFQRAEAFELPFIMTTGEATSRAFQDYADRHMANDFPGLKVIAVHTHGPGVLHTKAPVNTLADLEGMKLRGPTRVITGMLGKLGAVPVGMPVPAMPQALSKGVIDGTVIPWEITLPLKISELVHNHTEFTGVHGLYTATFVFAMNRDSYENLPDDLKQVIDANSGVETAAWAGRVMDSGDVAGRRKAAADGNSIVTLDTAETARWAVAASSVVSDWVAEMKGKGIDGQALVDDAKALIEKHSR